jgi:hypothetical protein
MSAIMRPARAILGNRASAPRTPRARPVARFQWNRRMQPKPAQEEVKPAGPEIDGDAAPLLE